MKTKFWIMLIALPLLLVGAPFAGPPNASLPSASIKLTWQDNSDNEDEFVIERFEFTEFRVEKNETTFVDKTVQPGKTYCYRVRARNGCGDSASSNMASVEARLPEPPTASAPAPADQAPSE